MFLAATNRKGDGKLSRPVFSLTLFLAVAVLLVFGAQVTALAADTTLTVELKGVTPNRAESWLTLSLNGSFDVFVGDSGIGRVTANPTAEQTAAGETDTIVIPADIQGEVTLQPVGEIAEGYDCEGPIAIPVTQGAANRQTVLAYAQRGLFTVENTAEGGETSGSAEFMVLDAQGTLQWSFTTGEDGRYTADHALPNGDYQLVQMRAPQGTLLLDQPVDFSVGTYRGTADSMTAVQVVNPSAPSYNGQTGNLSLGVDTSEGNAQEASAEVTVSGLCAGENDLALMDYTVTLNPATLLDAEGADLAAQQAVQVESLTVNRDGDGNCRVQPLNASGAPAGEPTVCEPGETVTLQNAAGAAVTYLNAQGEASVPEGFSAGTLQLSLRYTQLATLPTERAAVTARLTAAVGYTYQYPDSDGISTVTATSAIDPAAADWTLPDGRFSLGLAAEMRTLADGTPALALKAAESELPDEALAMAVELPAGSRVQTGALADDLRLIRTAKTDWVVLDTARWAASDVEIPIASGTVSTLTAWVNDPCTLPKTADNPQGDALRADRYAAQPLVDALLGTVGGRYARADAMVSNPVTATGEQPVLTPLLSGRIAEQTEPSVIDASNLGVLLTDEQEQVLYGVQTDATGAFALSGDAALTQGILRISLPLNTAEAATGQQGVFEQAQLALPQEGYTVSVIRTSSLSGTVTTAVGRPVARVQLAVSQMGQLIESTASDENGSYAFTGLSQGTYTVHISLPAGSSATLTADEGLSQVSATQYTLPSLSLAYGEQHTLNLSATVLGSVRGEVTDTGEPAAGLALSLTASDGTASQAITGDDGSYAVTGLAEGEYTLTLTLPEHKAAVEVNGDAVHSVGAYAQTFTLGAGETRDDRIALETTASLQGRMAALGAGQTIAVASVDTQLTTQTQADGSFSQEGLIGGDYTVYAPLPEGETLAADSPWKVTEKGDMIWITVSVAAGSTYTLPDADFVAMTGVEGVAYMDGDGDLTRGDSEQLMTGVPVALQRKDGADWADVADTTTDAYGHYAFQNLAPGVYRVAARGGDGIYVTAVGSSASAIGEEALGVKASGELNLASGEVVSGQSDIALGQPAGVKVAVFFDSNEDGQRGVYERSVAGVTVEAVPASDAQGTAAASAVTDANGLATLEGLTPGSYVLRFTLTSGYLFTKQTGRWSLDASCVGGGDSGVETSDELTLTAGQTAEAGAGVIPVGSFSGTVWSDLNNNGVLDEGEPGVPNVILTLEGTRTGLTYTFTTDDTGAYSFPLLRNDAYNFTAEIPDGMLFARYTQTGGDSRSVFTTEGTKATRQFIVDDAEDVKNKNVGVVEKAALSGIAFLDTNYNGVYDEGEPPYAGVTVELVKNSNDRSQGKVVTGEDGRYAFDALRGGDYRLRAILPNDGGLFTLVPEGAEGLYNQFEARESRRENTLPSVTLVNGQTTETCVGVAVGATITGTVFLDAKYDGARDESDKKASGVKVQLVDASGTLIASDTTNANGRYTLEGIMPGAYTVRFQRRDGYAFTRYRPQEKDGNHVQTLAKDGFGETEVLQVAMGQTVEQINAGMLPSSTLTGLFFDDLNDNGLQDEGEGGYTDGRVRLLSSDGELDLTETVAEDGTYFFDGVMPGEYTVTYLLPDNATLAKVADGGNTLEGQGAETALEGFSVESGKAYTAPLVGAVTLGTFEGVAYHDQNGNGVKDENEETLSDVQVVLTPGRSDLDASETVTGADGAFSLTGLRPSSYRLTLTLPEGYIFSGDLAASGLSLTTETEDTVSCPWAALINRAQNWVGAVKPATIRASVWLDENRDGTQTEDERLYAGLSYELYDEALGKVVKTARSDDDGYVTFTNVRPASYTVRFTIPAQAQPAGDSQSTFTAQGAMMSHSGIAVGEGETFDRISGGLVSYTSIGGAVALDVGGERTLLSDVNVYLYQGDQTEPVQATTTDEQGVYRFDDLWPDSYRIAVAKPDGMIFVKPDDPNYPEGESVITATEDGLGTSDPFALEMAQHRLAMDAVLIQPARVGDQVWLDQNANGLVDADEPSINGVTIELLSGGEVAYTTTSNEWGYYEFADVYPGEYILRAEAYPELTITTPVPALRLISSCLTAGDGDSATSDPFQVESGSKNFSYDLGYILRDGQPIPSAIQPGAVQSWVTTPTTE